jgi:hypothetical protein
MRIKNPDDPDGPWHVLEAPDMPRLVRGRRTNNQKYLRERPVYTVHPDGDITVQQSFLPGQHSASMEEMHACDDRLEVDAYGKIQFRGPLRSKVRRAGGFVIDEPQAAHVEEDEGRNERKDRQHKHLANVCEAVAYICDQIITTGRNTGTTVINAGWVLTKNLAVTLFLLAVFFGFLAFWFADRHEIQAAFAAVDSAGNFLQDLFRRQAERPAPARYMPREWFN